MRVLGDDQAHVVAEGLVQYHRDAPQSAGYRIDRRTAHVGWLPRVALSRSMASQSGAFNPEDIEIEWVGNRHVGREI